ncbi:MAG: primosomal protein N', partial [Clostridia bacterium]|nr:primosomal protein N' [Clostridia bacterium]
RILLGKADVVVGARSAVFAPLKKLRLIIIDEEHEPSYSSQNKPRYTATEIAIQRAKLNGSVVVLGSATPKIESYMKAQMGKYTLLTLKKRANAQKMPNAEIVDMRNEFANGNNSIFSVKLQEAMKKCLDAGEQAILFINRRGYSTFVSCRSCGYVFKCPNCDVSLVYHKNTSRMNCHYCGHSERLPKLCPECSKPYIKYFGVGTEQVEEQVRAMFPDIKTLRMDMDTTRTKNSHYEILNKFYKGEAQVLIGTQMVAKGLDIKNVTLVGVIAADASLFHSDYRSAERTFQLLTQVAGRAGRDSSKTGCGEVIIQTYCPEHTAVTMSANHDYEGFYAKEIAVRRASMFPPFSLFVRILFVGDREDVLCAQSEKYMLAIEKEVKQALASNGANIGELMLMYASPAPIKRREGLYRYQVIMKLARTKHTAKALEAVYSYIEEHPAEHIASVEINPDDMI